MTWLPGRSTQPLILILSLGLISCTDVGSSLIPDAGGSAGKGDSTGAAGSGDSVIVPRERTDAAAPADMPAPVEFMVPTSGGNVMVGGSADANMKVAFDFPPSAAGQMIMLTPTAAANIGWSADQFSQVIKMEPDGATFADPIVIRPASGDVLAFDFASSADKSRPEPLPLNSAGDGLLLSHFSTLAVLAPERSCQSGSGWKVSDAAASAQHCPDPAFPTYIQFDCNAYAYCVVISAHCCARVGASACHLGDSMLGVTYTAASNDSEQYAYCNKNPRGDAGSASPDAGNDAGTSSDAGSTTDSGAIPDATSQSDASSSGTDSGTASDGGVDSDASSSTDAGANTGNDSGVGSDSGQDAGSASDAGPTDASAADGGTDSGVPDAGPSDGGQDDGAADASQDGGAVDADVDAGEDGGDADGGTSQDSGVPDAGLDAGQDGGAADGGVDASQDAGQDGGVDASQDSGVPDAGQDGGAADAGMDASQDAGTGLTCSQMTTWNNIGNVPDAEQLLGVWGELGNDSNVFAVGRSKETQQALVAYFDGTDWTNTLLGAPGGMLTAIWGTDVAHMIAVGKGGTIYATNGSSWIALESPTSQDLFGVWGTDRYHFWVVGANGTAWAFTGETWVDHSIVGSPSNNIGTLRGVWGTALDNVWVVNSTGAASSSTYVVHHYNGSWAGEPNTASEYYTEAIWGDSVDDIWAVGYIKSPAGHFDGKRWGKSAAPPAQSYLRGVWGRNQDNVWAVGDGGRIDYWNGSAWSSCANAPAFLNSVVGTNSRLWAVGVGGLVMRGDPN